MSGYVYIYALIDPRDGRVRYIGKSNQPEVRFEQHLKLDGCNAANNDWLTDLVLNQLQPELCILEEVEKGQAVAAERKWITLHLDSGCPLTNIKMVLPSPPRQKKNREVIQTYVVNTPHQPQASKKYMNTRIDRFKVKRRMEQEGIDTFETLAKEAKLSPTTVYSALDGYNWRSTTLDAIAAALGCNPMDIVTVDADADLPKARAFVGVAA